MGMLPDNRRSVTLRPRKPPAPGTQDRERAGASYEIRFVPARWLVLLLGIASAVLRGGKFTKLGLIGLVWSVTPRPVKIAAGGFAAAAAIVVFGAVAAIALLALQIS
jgi:hypothetical protein